MSEEDHPILYITVTGIVKDYKDSPYTSFNQYWIDHELSWSSVFKKDFFLEVSYTLFRENLL